LLGSVVVSTAVLLGSAVLLYVLLRAALTHEMDISLADEARMLASLVEEWNGRIEFELAERDEASLAMAERPGYFQLWRQDGAVLERSLRLGSRNLDRISGSLDRPVCRFVVLPDGRRGRMAGVTFTPRPALDEGTGVDQGQDALARSPAAQPVTLVVARECTLLDQRLAQIRTILLVVVGGALLLSLTANAIITRVGLRPLQKAGEEIRNMDGKDLAARLDPADAPTEIQQVIVRLNDLLGRLEASFLRERAFSQNVAHELRTPLAGLRSTIDVALAQPRPGAEYQSVLRKCQTICVQTQAIIENLLSLARIDAGQCDIRQEPVRVDQVIQEEWKTFASKAEARCLHVTQRVASNLIASTDRRLLCLILHNLFENATSYANPTGAVEVEADRRNGVAVITVRNSGSRVSQQDVARVCDRFWRGDAARGETGQHAGLGLSLCQELAERIGAPLSIESQEGGQFIVQLQLPAE
jgi:signal transduction histidine kinase